MLKETAFIEDGGVARDTELRVFNKTVLIITYTEHFHSQGEWGILFSLQALTQKFQKELNGC